MPGDIYVSFGADTGGLEAAFALAKAQTSAFAAEVRALATEMTRSGAAADSDLAAKLTQASAGLSTAKAHAAELSQELRQHRSAAEGAGEGIATLRDGLIRFAEVAGIAFSVEAIKAWISSTAEAAEKIQSIGAKLGATPEQVQQLGAVARLTGTDFEAMQTQVERLQLSLAKTGSAASPAAAALRALGIGVREFRALSPVDQLDAAAEAFARYADGANKTAIAQALFGRAGADMIPFLDRGREGMEELRQTAAATGVVMSGAMVAAFAQTQDHINQMSLAWQGLSQRIFSVVNPAIDAAIQQITKLIEKMDVNAIRADVQALADTAIELGAAIAEFAVAAEAALDGVIAKWQYLQRAGELARDALNAPLAALTGIVGDLQKGFAGASSSGGDLTARLAGIAKGADDAKAKMHELLAAGAPSPYGGVDVGAFGPRAGAKAQAPQLDIGGPNDAKAQSQAVEQAFRDEVQAAEDAQKGIRATLDEELKTHQITMSQWLAQTTSALDKEQDAIQDAADKAIASAGLTSAQKVSIAAKEEHDIAELAVQLQQAQAKAAEETQKQWQDAANTIESAFNSQLRGLLAGTTTWSQAMKNIAGDLVIKFIEEAEKMVVQWVVGEATKTAASQAGAAARTASGAAEAGAGLAQDAATALKSIVTSAASTFAGVFGFLAPVLGPAAAGPAAAAEGTVLGAAGAVASADIGMWQVPGDQLAMIHHNELVMPAAQAGAFRDMLSAPAAPQGGQGGSVSVHPTTNVHVSALDAGSVSQWMKSNSSTMLKAIDEAVRHGSALGLRRLAAS